MVFTASFCVLVLVAVACASPTEDAQSYKITDGVEVIPNGQPVSDTRGEQSLEDTVEKYIQGHDVTVELPLGAAATVSAREMDSGVMNFKLKFSESDVDEGRSKKKKLKKILIPIAVLLLMKALTLIPLILGVLGIKTWNALQLSFITFVTSFGMAIYELCKKLSNEHPPIVTHAHEHWDAQYAQAQHRSFDETEQVDDAQQMAYSAYNY